jgi:hypothetical protein
VALHQAERDGNAIRILPLQQIVRRRKLATESAMLSENAACRRCRVALFGSAYFVFSGQIKSRNCPRNNDCLFFERNYSTSGSSPAVLTRRIALCNWYLCAFATLLTQDDRRLSQIVPLTLLGTRTESVAIALLESEDNDTFCFLSNAHNTMASGIVADSSGTSRAFRWPWRNVS